MLDKLWDDVVAGPQPDHGLDRLRKNNFPTKPIAINILNVGQTGSSSSPSTPTTPATPSTPTTPFAARKESVWWSVFHPGSNSSTRTIGGEYFDKPQPNSPTVYDWLYSDDTRSKHR